MIITSACWLRKVSPLWFGLLLLLQLGCGGGAATDLVIPRGANISVRLDEALDTETSKAGDQFRALLSTPLQKDEITTYVPLDSEAVGVVEQAGITSGTDPRARLSVRLTGLRLPSGQVVSLETVPLVRESTIGYRSEDVDVTTGLDVDLDRLLGRAPGEESGNSGSELRVEVPVGSPLVFTLQKDVSIPEP